MGYWFVCIPESGRDRWVSREMMDDVVVLTVIGRRKQARRTGMAGPLGEMFDHGMRCALCS
jgi:hypothetical protein